MVGAIGATLSQIVRAKIINNSNLASIANHYSFGARLHINVSQGAVLREAESILGTTTVSHYVYRISLIFISPND